jgi:hypothetical protein
MADPAISNAARPLAKRMNPCIRAPGKDGKKAA